MMILLNKIKEKVTRYLIYGLSKSWGSMRVL
jgi:hypothetical protein